MDRLDRCTMADALGLLEEADLFERQASLFDGVVPAYATRLRENAEQIRCFASLILEHHRVRPQGRVRQMLSRFGAAACRAAPWPMRLA